MNEYRFPCPDCGQCIPVTVEQAGLKVQCPTCKKISTVPVSAVSNPRPLPPAHPQMTGVPPVIVGSVISPGTLSELERQVLEGGRFVVFEYCVSILVMTFRRPSPVMFLRADESGTGPALGYSAISFVAGWWGIPWGPIWTVTSLADNLSGGKDVTQAVLAEKVGPARAAQIVASRQRGPAEKSSKALWLALGGAAAILAILVFGLTSLGKAGTHHDLRTGEGRFRAANERVDMYRGDTGYGNSPQAVAVAHKFSSNMKRLRAGLFDGGKANGFSLSHHEFLTYCELQDDKCVLIVHVPELRRFTDSAKASIGDLAWFTAQSTLESQKAGQPGMKLAVALRGVTLYDRALVGVYQPGTDSTNLPSETITGSHVQERLFPFFELPATPPDSQNATN